MAKSKPKRLICKAWKLFFVKMIPHELLCKVFASRERFLPHCQLLHLLQPLET